MTTMTGQASAAPPSEDQASDMANRNADINDPAHIRAKILAAMWHHSQINPNGFNAALSREQRRRRRAEIRAEIDHLLDEYKTSMTLIALEHATYTTE